MNLISLEYYSSIYYNLILFVVIITWLSSFKAELTSDINAQIKNLGGLLLLVIIVLYMGLRPINGIYFGDTQTYADYFALYKLGRQSIQEDIGFDIFMNLCARIMNVNLFFVICAALYTIPLYFASKKWFGPFWFYAFLILVASFSFWPYGTNGIRNGLATSFLLLAFAYSEKRVFSILIMLLSLSFHKSMMLPIAACFATFFIKDIKKPLYFWLLCIPLSLLVGNLFETLVGNTGFADERLKTYLVGSADIDAKQFSSIGFRWDFLIYSSIGTFAGWYFIIKRNFIDITYQRLYNTYLISNGIWIILIRASFSNRFAYLSWFMLGIIIVYPFLKTVFFEKQHRVLSAIITIYFLFTYLLNVVLIKR